MQRFLNIQASSLQIREAVNFKQPKTNRKTTSERASGNCWRTVEQNFRRFDNLCRFFWTIKTVKSYLDAKKSIGSKPWLTEHFRSTLSLRRENAPSNRSKEEIIQSGNRQDLETRFILRWNIFYLYSFGHQFLNWK